MVGKAKKEGQNGLWGQPIPEALGQVLSDIFVGLVTSLVPDKVTPGRHHLPERLEMNLL